MAGIVSSFNVIVSVSLENYCILALCLEAQFICTQKYIAHHLRGHISKHPFVGHKETSPPRNLGLSAILCLLTSFPRHQVYPLPWSSEMPPTQHSDMRELALAYSYQTHSAFPPSFLEVPNPFHRCSLLSTVNTELPSPPSEWKDIFSSA